jgi:hypothetical protein
MIDIRYKEIPIKTVTEKAYREMAALGMDLYDVKEILENGFDCSRSKRRKGIEEKCLEKKGETIKAVVEKMTSKSGIEYWRIRHVGYL